MIVGAKLKDQADGITLGLRATCVPCLLKLVKCDVRMEDMVRLYEVIE
ncbi:MAG TPA: hypothetical protein VFH17_08295 [Coriobacteriia bacterium]|nr:hypothetical protein [Coriobacteriia bacterium]